jgi:hypothetical protein
MKFSLSLLSTCVLSFILIYGCSTEEEESVAPVVQTPQPEPEQEEETQSETDNQTQDDTSNESGDIDSDGDGLSNQQEADLDTDPENSDTDGDGVIDSEDYAPLNPFLTYDDWGEFKEEYAEVFYSSDISESTAQQMIRAIEMWQDVLGSIGGEIYVVGPGVDEVYELVSTFCDRRIERGEFFGGDMNDNQIKSFCMTAQYHPNAPTEWMNQVHLPDSDYGRTLRNDLSNFEGHFAKYRRMSAKGGGIGSPGFNRGENNFRMITISAPTSYDEETNLFYDQTYGVKVPPWRWTEFFANEFYTYIYSFYNTEKEYILDEINGDWIRPNDGPDWISGGRFYWTAYMSRKLYNDGVHSFSYVWDDYRSEWPASLREYMTHLMELAQEEYQNCPDFRLEDLRSNTTCTYYHLGAWAHAYLRDKMGGNVNIFTKVLHPKIEEMGFVAAFEDTFNLTYEELNIEFKQFLNLPLEEQLEIIPDISY